MHEPVNEEAKCTLHAATGGLDGWPSERKASLVADRVSRLAAS